MGKSKINPVDGDDDFELRRPCKYIGSFAINMMKVEERQSLMNERLDDLKNVKKGIHVVLMINAGGIKVYDEKEQEVKLAHAIMRVAFSTCSPDTRLFAYVARSLTSSKSPSILQAHVFKTKKGSHAQQLAALVSKAFRVAFAMATIQRKTKCAEFENYAKTQKKISPVQDRRRWAKKEIARGHDLSEHAERAKKHFPLAMLPGKSEPVDSQILGSPPRKPSTTEFDNQRLSQSAETSGQADYEEIRDFRNSSIPEDSTRVVSVSVIRQGGKETEPRRPPGVMQSRKVARSFNEPPGYIASEYNARASIAQTQRLSQDNNEFVMQSFERSESNITEGKIWANQKHDDDHVQTYVKMKESADKAAEEEEEHYYVQNNSQVEGSIDLESENLYVNVATSPRQPMVELQEDFGEKLDVNNAMSPNGQLPTDMSPTDMSPNGQLPFEMSPNRQLPNGHLPTEMSPNEMSPNGQLTSDMSPNRMSPTTDKGRPGTPYMYPATTNTSVCSKDRVGTITDAQLMRDSYWYQEGLSREIAEELLSHKKVGSFFIRKSTSVPGSFAMSMRVPKSVKDSGIGNILIEETPEGGYKIPTFSRSFESLPMLVAYYASFKDELPVKLRLDNDNPLFDMEDGDDVDGIEAVDLDYKRFDSSEHIMSELATQ